MTTYNTKKENTLTPASSMSGSDKLRVITSGGESKLVTWTNSVVAYVTSIVAGYLKKDGSVPLDGGYSPSAALDIATKGYVNSEDAAEVVARNAAIKVLSDALEATIAYGSVTNLTNPVATDGTGGIIAYPATPTAFTEESISEKVLSGNWADGEFAVVADGIYEINISCDTRTTSGSLQVLRIAFENIVGKTVPTEVIKTVNVLDNDRLSETIIGKASLTGVTKLQIADNGNVITLSNMTIIIKRIDSIK